MVDLLPQRRRRQLGRRRRARLQRHDDGAFNADTFRIWKDTQHPDEAFQVLEYLLGDASAELLTTYGAMPAREPTEQAAFFETLGRHDSHPER